MSCKSKDGLESGKKYIFEAFRQAYQKFHKFCVLRHRKLEFRENSVNYAQYTELYDIFFFYGRIFKDKYLREGVKAVLSDIKMNHMAVNYIFKIIDFLINFIDDPNTYSGMITQNESDIILQAIFSPQNARLPDNSKMYLNTIASMLIKRSSPFIKYLESFLSEFKSDKHNREFNYLYESYTGGISKC